LNRLFFDLLDLLKQEMEQYRKLLDLLKRERNAMIRLSLEEIEGCYKLKETIILKLRIMEESRLVLIDKIAGHLKISKEGITLLKISDIVKSPFSEEFKRCRKNLSCLIHDIAQMNRKNKVFIEDSLECINGHLTLLNDLINPNPVYLPSGKFNRENHFSNKILSKEA